ncbi:hypothetical protein HHL22_16220 [Hymenobacter sp. RP-2-7]|uniref:Uncharacterized protein n=1 Tax=Hymenobacter polaris TaxID=2682546 RepID=A0A7Y0AG65_9BACT|nr:hypothetical protein [Hymenobacter polaris]NML66754.1 hypothetical protein [Hymenobacter polaris]
MKLQLTPQSLRLRLAAEEVAEFGRTGQLTQVLHLGPGAALTYALRQLPDDAPAALGPRAHFAAGMLTVEVPAALARQLVAGTTVSLKSETAGTNGQLLRILVEQDLGPSH